MAFVLSKLVPSNDTTFQSLASIGDTALSSDVRIAVKLPSVGPTNHFPHEILSEA